MADGEDQRDGDGDQAPATSRPLWMGPPSATPPGSPAVGPPPPAAPPVASSVAVPPGAYPAPWGGLGWWDGYQWSQLPGTHPYGAPYQPVAGLARATQVLLGLLVASNVVGLIVDIGRYRSARDVDFGEASFEAFFGGGNGLALLVSLVSSIIVVPTAIVFLVWRYRIQQNLSDALGAGGLEFTPGWAVGWWFVPILNLWKPKQAMDEAWLASDPLATAGGRGWAARRSDPLITWWWALWLLSGLVRLDFGGSSDLVVTAGEIRRSLAQEMASHALVALAAYLAIRVVGEITGRHRAKANVMGVRET